MNNVIDIFSKRKKNNQTITLTEGEMNELIEYSKITKTSIIYAIRRAISLALFLEKKSSDEGFRIILEKDGKRYQLNIKKP